METRKRSKRWGGFHWAGAALVALLLLGISATPARAHVHFSFGIGLPFVGYSYAPAYRYPYAAYPYDYGYGAPYYTPYGPSVSFSIGPRYWGPRYGYGYHHRVYRHHRGWR